MCKPPPFSATTTFSGDGNLILAKFKSFLGHIVNKHKDLSDPLFNQCARNEDIAPRTWLKEGGFILFSLGFFTANFVLAFLLCIKNVPAHNRRIFKICNMRPYNLNVYLMYLFQLFISTIVYSVACTMSQSP